MRSRPSRGSSGSYPGAMLFRRLCGTGSRICSGSHLTEALETLIGSGSSPRCNMRYMVELLILR